MTPASKIRITTSVVLLILGLMSLLAIVMGQGFTDAAQATQDGLQPLLRWYYPLCVAFFLGFMGYIGLGPHAGLRLGDDHEQPEFNRLSWLSMLFAAGTGVGLLFWSVAQPMEMLGQHPFGNHLSPADERMLALRLTFFHWGLNGWAIFAVTGVCMAYAAFRRHRSLAISATLAPLIGRRSQGWVGYGVDALAVLATIIGITTTLGLGVEQINAGLGELADLPQATGYQLLVILVVTLVATVSVLSGLRRGVRILSEVNILLSIILLLAFLFIGETGRLMAILVQATGAYLQHLPGLSFYTGADDAAGWQQQWTVFYWAWWIAWSPFVGLFIARISRGRTLGEYAFGVLVVPSVFSFLWISWLGGTALQLEDQGAGIAAAMEEDVARALFVTIAALPTWPIMITILSWLALILIGFYYITSADSGTLVITSLLQGDENRVSRGYRGAWALGMGALTAVLLYAGGIEALQATVTLAALPFSVLILLMVGCLITWLRLEPTAPTRPVPRPHQVPHEPWAGEEQRDEEQQKQPARPRRKRSTG
ncbi:MAG: BCCT family transporter [Planctomycetota bacterium]